MKILKMPMCVLALLACLALAAPVSAQDGGGTINVSWDKAFMDNTNLLNSVFWFSYMRPMGSLTITADVPFSNYDPDITGADGSSAIGNPRIGVMKYSEGSPFMYMAGVRLPLAGDDIDAISALVIGSFTNPLYAGPWMSNTTTVDVGAAWFKQNDTGFSPYVQLGVEAAFISDTAAGQDSNEMFLPFVVGGSMAMGENSLMFGVVGNMWLTEDDGFPGDGTTMAVMAGYEFSMGSMSPSVWFGLPISSDYSDAVDFLFSLGLGFHIP